MSKKLLGSIFLCAAFVSTSLAQRELGARPTDSGGVLMAEQAAYDVQHYDLALKPNAETRSIEGVLTVTAKILKPLDYFVMDLDSAYTIGLIQSVSNGSRGSIMQYERRGGRIWIKFDEPVKAGQEVKISIPYQGKPKEAPRPPWVGGFVWKQTKDGQPWYATAVQNDGADLWFPVKDHPSDKPETTSLHFTVPANLVAASNGKLASVVDNKDGTKTFNWEVSQPISNYCIALNVAPYKVIKDSVKSMTGETIPIEFYVLPQDEAKGKSLVELTKKYNQFFEKYLGPYPFRSDKIGIAETPHLGMEHQSITAYGNEFKYNADGDDWLLFHEFGHEWWANLVTAPDWNDFWIHEGTQSFMDTFYVETTKGKDAYFAAMKNRYRGLKNVKAVAPRDAKTTTEIYMLPPDYTNSDGDIYGKGALILHSLRYLIGDDAFFKTLRQTTYPNASLERNSKAAQFHFTTTDDFLRTAEKASGKDLKWFFEVYLRQPSLPKLNVLDSGNQLILSWETANNLPFSMPVEVKIGGEIKRVEMKNGKGSVTLPNNTKYDVDPNGWILKTP